MSTRTRNVVCAVKDVGESGLHRVEIRGRAWVVVRGPDGTYHALRDLCPHEGAPLSAGNCMNKVIGDEPGQFTSDPSTIVLRCPWHGYEFDVTNGQCIVEPDRIMVRHMALEIEGDDIVLPSRR